MTCELCAAQIDHLPSDCADLAPDERKRWLESIAQESIGPLSACLERAFVRNEWGVGAALAQARLTIETAVAEARRQA